MMKEKSLIQSQSEHGEYTSQNMTDIMLLGHKILKIITEYALEGVYKLKYDWFML